MRPMVKNGIALFSPQGFLDGNSSRSLFSIEDMAATTTLKVDMVLVSLKKVVFFNRNGLDIFMKLFSKVRKATHATVGFCDYDDKKYKAIKVFYKDELDFSLFKTVICLIWVSSSRIHLI